MRNSNLPSLVTAAAALLACCPASADDNYLKAASLQLTLLAPCGGDKPAAKTKACTSGKLPQLAGRANAALDAALARAQPQARPLLKRDQAWFLEMFGEFDAQEAGDAETGADDDSLDPADRPITREAVLEKRIEALGAIGEGLGRTGYAGSWRNAFGAVTITPADGGALRVVVETRTTYGIGSDRRFTCKAEAVVRPAGGGWLQGEASAIGDDGSEPAKDAQHPLLRLIRQGDTLRLLAGNEAAATAPRLDCNNANQLTGTYFPAGKSAERGGDGKPRLVLPSFDCTRPATVDEEEICADPELAEDDLRLNRGWQALLPRLDGETLAALKKDQRDYVRAQANQYIVFLQPAWNKQYYYVHNLGLGRDKLKALQRERIALIEGFDEKRQGLAGLWLSSTAVLDVAIEGGKLTATGWKWTQGDWKAGCSYDMEGPVSGGRFVAPLGAGRTRNPDTLERDAGVLVVNRNDDEFAARRHSEEEDPPKCKRNYSYSSTTRLFPVRRSPDIDTSDDIR